MPKNEAQDRVTAAFAEFGTQLDDEGKDLFRQFWKEARQELKVSFSLPFEGIAVEPFRLRADR